MKSYTYFHSKFSFDYNTNRFFIFYFFRMSYLSELISLIQIKLCVLIEKNCSLFIKETSSELKK